MRRLSRQRAEATQQLRHCLHLCPVRTNDRQRQPRTVRRPAEAASHGSQPMKRQPNRQKPPARKQFLPQPLSTQDEALALEDTIEQNQQFDPGIPARIQDVDNPDPP